MPAAASSGRKPVKKAMVEAPPADETRDLPLAFTSFQVPAPINAKNVSTTFLKHDSQSWSARRGFNNPGPLAPGMVASRGRKRRRATDKEDADRSRAASTTASGLEDENSDDADEEEEDEADINPASKTIVIHPSSTSLRIALATDLFPRTLVNVIARRDKIGAPPRAPIKSTLPSMKLEGEDAEEDRAEPEKDVISSSNRNAQEEEMEVDGTRKSSLSKKIDVLRTDLRKIMRAMKLRPVTNGRGLAAQYNESARSENIPGHADVTGVEWTMVVDEETDTILGQRATRLPQYSSGNYPNDEPVDRPWELFWPFRAGRLNIEPYVERYGQSAASSALSKDIQSILLHAISLPRDASESASNEETLADAEEGLGISPKDLHLYSAVLVVPDLYSPTDVEQLVDLLLCDLKFAAICVQQESVCATFGAGQSGGCVVHLGSERIAISCIDEGLVYPESRISLAYGGRDVSLFFAQLLKAAKLSYAELDPDRRLADRWLIDDLKHRLSTLDATQLGLTITEFYLRLPSKPTVKYTVRTYDEVILAPMALFSPRVVDFKSKQHLAPKTMENISREQRDEGERVAVGSGSDVAITQAMKDCVQHLLPVPVVNTATEGTADAAPMERSASTTSNIASAHPAAATVTTPAASANKNSASPMPPGMQSLLLPNYQEGIAGATKSEEGGETKANGGAETSRADTPLPKNAAGGNAPAATSSLAAGTGQGIAAIDVPFEASKVPLDVALWNSIKSCLTSQLSPAAAEERIKRLAGNILCTGGSALIPGLGAVLEARLNTHLESWAATELQKDADSAPLATVIPSPRDMDPRILASKGAAVLARLESVGELWVFKEEWEMFGWRALREKSLFL
ncbi:Actin-related protein [Ceraceosorus bombacis]|uniref:Actin-related protein n=1 Tax=Ceraceosorus bombacis TaxID=401625 RepID=A0A0P1BBX8_9BASI|nr:Actin-related protein [Ceraceosorus bombacis]